VYEVIFESHNKYVVSLNFLRLCVLEGKRKKVKFSLQKLWRYIEVLYW